MLANDSILEIWMRLKLSNMYDLAEEMNEEYTHLRDRMIETLGKEEYVRITKGSTGAMSRARKGNYSTDYSRDLKKDLTIALERDYTIYDLSNLISVNVEVLISLSKEYLRTIEEFEVVRDRRLSYSRVSKEDILSSKDEKDFQSNYLIREWEVYECLRHVLKEEIEVRRVLNNQWKNKNYSEKKLQSLADRVISQIEKMKTRSSSIDRLYSDRSSNATVEQLFLDRYSDEEISKMKSLDLKEVRKLTRLMTPRKSLSKTDSDKIGELMIESIKTDESIDLSLLEDLVSQGRMSLDEFCEEVLLPIKFKSLVSDNLVSKESLRKCSSKIAARSSQKTVSHLLCREKILSKDLMKKVFEDLISSGRISENLYQISRARDVNNRKDVVMKYLKRYKDIAHEIDSYPDSKVLDTLCIDITQSDALEFKQFGLLEIEDLKMSKLERKIADLLDDNNVSYLIQDRSLLDYSYELDFVIPSFNLAIEVSPISSHHSNQSLTRYFEPKPKNYHFRKYQLAEKLGYTLITLYEHDLEENVFEDFTRPLIERYISTKSRKIYARDTRFKEIDTREARRFLEIYHRDGYRQSSRKFALFHNKEIVAVATVSKMNDHQLRLERLAFRRNETVVGAVSKLTKNILRKMNAREMVTFSDNDKGSGDSYKRAGYDFIEETGPRKIYISNSDPTDRYSWQISSGFDHSTGRTVVGGDAKSKGLKIPETEEEVEEYIETELSHRSDDGKGYDRLYTAGSKKWKFVLNES